LQSFPGAPSADGQPLLSRLLRGNEDGDAIDRANAVTQTRARILRLVAAAPQGERLERFLPEAPGEAMTGLNLRRLLAPMFRDLCGTCPSSCLHPKPKLGGTGRGNGLEIGARTAPLRPSDGMVGNGVRTLTTVDQRGGWLACVDDEVGA